MKKVMALSGQNCCMLSSIKIYSVLLTKQTFEKCRGRKQQIYAIQITLTDTLRSIKVLLTKNTDP